MISHVRSRVRQAFTLLEMSIVIMVLIALISMGFYFNGAIDQWRAGSLAAETLRSVYIAQRTWLADNPTRTVADLAGANGRNTLLPYLPGNPATFPNVQGLEGQTLDLRITVIPPRLFDAGNTYDPSGNNSDGLWDVGQQ